MPFILIYILKLSVSLALVFLFYHLVLRKLTFYNWNRWYLLGYTILSFIIPFIDISTYLKEQNLSQNSIVEWVPVLQQTTGAIQKSPAGQSFSIWSLVALMIALGMLFMFIRLLVQLFSFYRLVKKAKPLDTGAIPGTDLKLYQVEADIIPFSFGNSIFINYHLHSREELREIVWHEFIHVKQKHSIDIICGELLCLLNWYNPFAWLLRRSIRQNLEFIADEKVLENGIGRKEYQYLLLKVIGNNHFSIAPKFNFSSLKKRIAMMNKMKSAGVHLVKFLFILPLLAVLLLAFRNQYERSQQIKQTVRAAQDTIPGISKQAKKLPPEISSINVIDPKDPGVSDAVKQKVQGMVVVKRKDGGIEVYELSKQESLDAFEKKYAVKLEDIIPPPPVPPTPASETVPAVPPVPPVPPAKTTAATNVNNPAAPATAAGIPVPPVATEAPTPVAEGVKGIDLRGISREYDITDKKAWIKLLDGKEETYDLTNKKEREAFEKKYGKLVNVNVNAVVNTNIVSRVNTNVNATVAPKVNVNVNTKVDAKINTNVNSNIHINKTVELAPITATPATLSETAVLAPAARPAAKMAGLSTTLAPTSGVAGIDDYGYRITGKEHIVITITKNSTRQDLDKFIVQMKEKGVELDFDVVEFNSKGLLISINGTMSSGGSRSNFVAVDFEKLILAMIRKGDKVFFKVSTTDNKRVI